MARRVARKKKRKLSTAAWFGIGCGSVIVLGLIAAGILWVMLTGEPQLPPEASAGTPPGDAAGASQVAPTTQPNSSTQAAPDAPPLEQQVERVQQAERSDQPTRVTMTIRESELNAMLARESTGRVRDLTVYFGDGSIAATGQTDYRRRTVHLTVRGRPVVSGGAVQMQIDEVLIGRLTAPQAVHEQIREEFNRGIQRVLQDRNVRVERVQVRPDVMTLSGWVGGS